MGDFKLFKTNIDCVTQLQGHSVALEKSLQLLIERHLDVFLGIRFLATEYSTGKTHAGRIDTLGIDENGCPCIIEYKRSSNENVVTQGLFYLDWLLDHKAEFEALVFKKYGQEVADSIEWATPRLVCIAGTFTRYDEHAVKQITRNIDLIRYLRFGEEFLLLELVSAVQVSVNAAMDSVTVGGKQKKEKTVTDQLAQASSSLVDLFESLKAMCLAVGDDVQMTALKLYVAFKRIKNFATVVVQANANVLLVYVKIDPDTVELKEGFTRDVREIGHWGTGDLEITLRNQEDLEKILPLLEKSYEAS